MSLPPQLEKGELRELPGYLAGDTLSHVLRDH